ncbi:MAG: ATP-dependent helicase/nuclease subunit [Clostridiales bacterium]|jgi:ATP-dependent helicase/nuclease subunit A|nr:ATP-dependent helicase/nuclease subunit [Clostridiales bacterium]
MSDTKWTPEQKRAIDTRGCNLLVAAAAGAGKTAVLVERIIKKITDDKNPVDIDKLLVVTFTNAAASEMRERIGDAITRVLDENPDSKRLQRQLTLLNKSSITTIHSFCLEVIRNNFHLIDLDPNFRIGDETECTLLKQETMEEMFEGKYDDEVREDFLSLVESYSGSRDDSALQEMILNLYEFSRSTPWPEKWLHEMAEAYNVDEDFDFGTSSWANIIVKSIKIELMGVLEQTQRALSIIKRSEGLDPYLPAFQNDAGRINELLSGCDIGFASLYEGFSNLDFDKLPRCGKDVDKERQEIVKKIRDGVKDKLKSIKEDIFISDGESIKGEFQFLYPLMFTLSELVIEYNKRFQDKKREKGIIDFNDIEHFCLQILLGEDGTPSETALAIRDRFDEILVDEYQDSNMVQEVMLTTISKKDSDTPNMFMVGDVKQSIYRFRQAKPELFLDKYNRYPAEKGSRDMKILLYKNFRSRKEVVDSVNYIFKQIMSINIGELEYDSKEALNPGAEYKLLEEQSAQCGGPVELHLIEKNQGASSQQFQTGNNEGDNQGASSQLLEAEEDEDEVQLQLEEEEDIDAIQVEARMVGKRIRELMNPVDGKQFMVFDKNTKGYRPLEYRDIVILMRATSSWAPVFMEELIGASIPVYADTGTGYFNTTEVKTIMSLLQVIDNPLEDIPLLGVLRSPIGDFTEEELISIRLSDDLGYFYEALMKKSEEENELGNKAIDFITRLNAWRKKSILMSTDGFIWYLYIETGYYAYASAMPGGIQRQANLRLLFERAKQYEETSYKGLFNFINFINRLKKSSNDMGSAKILGENENVVRIMSIHKSKGLEFPVTIVSGCGKNFNMMDLNKSILLHQSLGFGPDYVDFKRRISYPSITKQALRKKIKLENLSEEMRILYVAFTRAREKLIITGSIKDVEKTSQRWISTLDSKEQKLPEYEVYKAKSYLDWICPAVLRHKNCQELREIAGIEKNNSEALIEDESQWKVKYWTREEVLESMGDSSQVIQKEQSKQIASGPVQDNGASSQEIHYSEYWEEIQKRLSWEYKYKMSSKLPTKLTVTELKRRFNADLNDENSTHVFTPGIVKKPGFLEEEKAMTGAEKGTIMHLIMQHLDLNRVSSSEEIGEQIEKMILDEMLTEKQAKSARIDRLEDFFKSELGQRMLKAICVKREVPFFIQLKSTEVYPSLPGEKYSDETILLQGIIDCYFEEEGEIVLVDYKTDYVNNENISSIKEKYKTQIDYYTMALERMTGMRVSGKYIYLFSSGGVLEYDE